MRVKEAYPLHDLIIRLVFEDGTVKVVDLKPLIHGPIFDKVMNNPEFLRDVRIEGGTITWANGADIDPDVLYYDLTPAWKEANRLEK